jgi:hypothetical protein
MTIGETNSETLLNQYNTAVEAWIAAIRAEEGLASATQSVAQIDAWEEASDAEDEARNRVKAVKKEYENALRQKFFNF